jgi:Fe-S cluster biogenesis protein NfuA
LHYAGSDTNNNTIDWSSSDMGQTNAPPYCPDGYILSGSTCNLSDSRQSIFDNSQDFWRSSSSPAIAAYGGDKVGTITGVSGTKTNSGDSLTFTGTAACSGCSSSSDTFQGLVGGGTSVTQQTQRTDASGASYVQSTTVSVAPDGTIAGTATQNVTGSLGTVAAADGSLPIIPAAAGAIPATPTMAQQNTPPLVMPTDYNREATQTSIKANTDSLVTAATVSSSSALPPDTESADIANLIGVGNMPSFDRSGLSGTIALPASDDNSCQPMALTFMGRPWPWDICPMVNYLHPLVNYLFVFLFGLLCFRTAFNKEELS